MERKNVNSNINFLKVMDIFKTPITLSYNKRYSYETKFGGVLTIITFIIIFAYTISNLIDLLQGNNYTIISNEIENYKYILDFSNVPFGFKLINSKGEDFPYDPTIYNYKIINTEYYFIQNSGDKTINYVEEKIEFDYCDKFFGNNKFYKNLDISNLICIKPGQNLTMYGKFGDSNGFRGFRIYVNRCNTKIENNTCLDIETINNKLANIKFIFFYLGYEINHYSNNKNIVQYKIINGENSLSINFMKKYYYRFQKAKYNLYNNLIFNNKEKIDFYLSNGYEYDFELDSSNSLASSDNSLGYFAFNTDAKIIEYTKTLSSLWDVFSKIGGVFNIVVSIAKLINSFISKRILLLDINEHLINKYSLVNNKIEINKDIKSILNNIDRERIPSKEIIRNDNSSVQINNKDDKLFQPKSKSNKIIFQENVPKVVYFSRKIKSSFKLFGTFKNIDRQSNFWFYICPFLFLQKTQKFKYFAQLEQNYNDYFSIENFLKVLEKNKIKIEKNLFVHQNPDI